MSDAPAATVRRLPRVLGLFDVSVLASASMGPAYSLASTLGLMVAVADRAAPLALVALVAIMLCIAVAFSRLARDYPSAGSSFAWAALAFGPRAGAYAAWLLLLSNYFATVAIALPAATYTLALLQPSIAHDAGWVAFVAILWVTVSSALLYVGMRPTAFATVLFLGAEFAVVVASAIAALFAHPVVTITHCPAGGCPRPPPLTVGGFATAMVLGIWMTDGWEVSSSASEETTGSARTPGRGGIAGLLVTAALLIFAMIAYQRVGYFLGFFRHQDDALVFVAHRLGGSWWPPVLLATVLVSSAATLWTTILYLSRSVFAMGRSSVLPEAVGTLDRRGVPGCAILAIYVATVAFLIATAFSPAVTDALDVVVNATAVFLGLLFVSSAFAAIRLVSTSGTPIRRSLAVPLIGGSALFVVIGFDIVQADATTRLVELAAIALGVPFAALRPATLRQRGDVGSTAPASPLIAGDGAARNSYG